MIELKKGFTVYAIDEETTRWMDPIMEHRHRCYNYWHPITRIHKKDVYWHQYTIIKNDYLEYDLFRMMY